MSPIDERSGTLAAQLCGSLTVEEPDMVGPLAVFPIITDHAGSLEYVSFADGAARGVTVKELDGQADVNALVVCNPLDVAVLLYEGEEVLGAQQNRTLDVSTLVAPGKSLKLPVTCVEAGRWQHERHSEDFVVAPQAAHPELRRRKNEQVRAEMAAAREPRADQQKVWEEVAATAARHGVASGTGAMHDVFERHRATLDEAAERVPMHCSQVGMLAAMAGRFVVLDYVSDVEAFASLQARLVQGYALDALDLGDCSPAAPSLQDARDFVALMLRATPARVPARGLGENLSFAFGALAGTGLAHVGEAAAITAFATSGHGAGQGRQQAAAGVARSSERYARRAQGA